MSRTTRMVVRTPHTISSHTKNDIAATSLQIEARSPTVGPGQRGRASRNRNRGPSTLYPVWKANRRIDSRLAHCRVLQRKKPCLTAGLDFSLDAEALDL